MKYDFDTVVDRAHAPFSYSLKWAGTGKQVEMIKKMCGLEELPEDRICTFTADMDFKCAPEIVEAMHKTAEHGIFGYSYAPDEYYQAIVGWFKTRFDWEIDPDHIIVGPAGTHELIAKCVQTYTQPGEGAIVLLPSYGYHGDVEAVGRKFVGVPMINTDNYFTVDFDAFEKACADPNNKIFIAMQPHNPTGRVFTVEEMQKLADICRRNGVIIVSDEVHIDIARKGVEVVPFMKAVGPKGVIITGAVNKTFNVAGLSMSHMIIEDEDLYQEYMKKNMAFGMASPFGISAVIAAYTQGAQWVDELNEYLDKILTYTVERFHKDLPKVKVNLPEGTYILWADFSPLGLSDEELAARIASTHVFCSDGPGFDATTTPRQWKRICLTFPMSVVERMCDNFAEAFKDLK